jgi:hypothetical protein
MFMNSAPLYCIMALGIYVNGSRYILLISKRRPLNKLKMYRLKGYYTVKNIPYIPVVV